LISVIAVIPVVKTSADSIESALDVKLTDDEARSLEEPYEPHAVKM
jgi:hypothetical protein